MLKELEKLLPSEADLLTTAPMLVCILIAGADNKIDNKEINKAIQLAKSGKAKPTVAAFYRTVSEDFEDKLKIILQGLPVESTKRNMIISEQLAQLNTILPKIQPEFANDFCDSLRYIAREIAESSGGLLGMNKIGDEEMKVLSLPMIKFGSIN